MSRKIVCESCGTIFPFEKAKDFTVCPVCNVSFDDEENESSTHDEKEEIDLDYPDMYFYSIDDEDKYEDKELRDIWCQCTTCREVNTIPYNHFCFITSEYVRLKKDADICCEECGKVVTNPIIPKRPDGWRELNMWEKDYDNLPKCPICHSTKIHKISMTNKAASALAFGVFAAGHVSKTYKCEVCGSKF